MARVVWTDEASRRLAGIVAYIAKDSPRNALQFERQIIEASRRMEILPFGGGNVQEFPEDEVREIYHGVYRILYVVRGETCYIVCVIHGSRDLSQHFQPSQIDLN